MFLEDLKYVNKSPPCINSMIMKWGSLSKQTPSSWRMCSCLKLLISWASCRNSVFSWSVAPLRKVCDKETVKSWIWLAALAYLDRDFRFTTSVWNSSSFTFEDFSKGAATKEFGQSDLVPEKMNKCDFIRKNRHKYLRMCGRSVSSSLLGCVET